MVDIHCHIIPNIDDGPRNFSDFVDMATEAVRSGVTDIFATPHHHNGRFENEKGKILKLTLDLNQYLLKIGIPLTIHPGQELRLHRDIFKMMEKDEVLTLGDQGRYLLLELPTMELPTYTHEVFYELLLKGVTPIIVHPERNAAICEEPNLLYSLVQEGALTQLTSGSIIGHFGKRAMVTSEKMIEHHLAHFIANDAHNINTRGFYLQKAYEKITKSNGIEKAFFFKENAQLLLNGQSVMYEQPIQIRRKILGIF